ncbi:hypothetical protein INS49_003284 [Diaporthe citri]|uniref:uncharacterized protein n=1 Tax=Diaporthe citri TaxID=83186 RepID=UPI001C7EE8FC|nr:uncharacterized protein INS49_003284 [Diaporthe citri]KAG6355323.1 hypothetical protein INS49_003284 [Diaporthe citri]
MAFDFNSDDERIALAGDDKEVYPHLGIINTSRWKPNEKYDPNFISIDPDDIRITGYHYSAQPGMLPLALNDLEQFANGLNSKTGYWAVLWLGGRLDNNDHVNADGFRCVVACGSVDLTIRPVQDSGGGHRLAIVPGDVRACLDAVANAILKADPENPIAGVIGRGSMASTEIPFEWQISHAPEDMRARRVQKWRYKGHQRRKRSSLEMSASQEIGPSLKRQSTGSSHWSSGSQSSLSSPSVASWGQPVMGPPPPVGPGQPGTNIEHMFRYEQSRRGSRGSRGSVGSAASRVGGLTLQPPIQGLPEGVAPPPAGSPWDGAQGVASWAPEHYGRAYEPRVPIHGQQCQGFPPQIPGHGYEGPGQVQQTPAYGQPTNVFGHMRTDFQGPPQREFRVGVQHAQQFAAHEGRNPQHRGQPQVPVGPAPEQYSYQRGHAGSLDAQSGSGYAGGSGHNVPPSRGSSVQGGGGYPPGFPPTQPAMHGGHFALPRQSQHMAAVPPEGGNDRSILENTPRVASPEPLDPTAAQSGQGNIPPSFPHSTQPVQQHQDMPPLPPPAMTNIDPAQLLARTTLPPVGHNYPSSMPPAQLPRPGGQDSGRLYDPPLAGDQPAYGDPFMGASSSEDDESDED